MSGGSKIRAIGPESAPEAQDAADAVAGETMLELEHEQAAPEWSEGEVAPRRAGWIVPALALLAIVGWTGFFGWAYRQEILAGGTPQQWTGWIVAWAVPALLVVAIWLLAMRTSRREARRFGEIADMLSSESQRLESRLTAVNRELSLAREFLAAQSRELDSLGRIAADRISTHADTLQSLVVHNGQQVEAIATVSANALENMTRLRDDLPVVANSARDVSNQIGAAGRTAHDQIAELVTGFARLNEFGAASERQVGALQSRVDAAISAFETQLAHIDDLAGARFDALRQNSEQFRAELDRREVDTLAAIRRRMEALDEELAGAAHQVQVNEDEALRAMRTRTDMLRNEADGIAASLRATEADAVAAWEAQVTGLRERLLAAIEEITAIDRSALESANRKLEALRAEAANVDRNIVERDAKLFAKIAERQSAIAKVQSEVMAGFDAQLATLDKTLADKQAALMLQTAELGQHSEAVAARLMELRDDIEAIAGHGQDAETRLAQNIAVLTERLVEGRRVLVGTDEEIAALTESSVRLLELLQASSQQTKSELPVALTEAEARLIQLGERTEALKSSIGDAAGRSEDLSAYVIAARDDSAQAAARIDALREKVEASNGATLNTLTELRTVLAAAAEDSTALSVKAQGELRIAIEALDAAARSAVAAIETDSGVAIRSLAGQVAEKAGEALATTLSARTAEAVAEVEQATARAAGASREATIQLRDQLARVNELAGNLENRVARARELAEEQVGNDFSRRVALITESLNSNAIDIEKALTTDVGDTAWAAYLRGDRGIFTRRAVRLLDNTEARAIAELYDADTHFRDNVSRYIADFENMLRTLLSTRDGKALGVTLLSSDMGKLYVALAQAIERLRD
jgi:hypothetical protein